MTHSQKDTESQKGREGQTDHSNRSVPSGRPHGSQPLDPALSRRPEARKAERLLEQSAKAHHEPLVAVESLQTPSHQLSLADRKKSTRTVWTPWKTVIWLVAFLVITIVPYYVGRWLALDHTKQLIAVLRTIDPRGWALLAWASVVILVACVGMAIGSKRNNHKWLAAAGVAFVVEQFLAGFSLLKWNFWYSTYIVFHGQDVYANAVNLGILAAAIGLLVFAVLFVAVLVAVKPESPLNALTQGASVLALFLVVELVAILVVIFGGMVTLV